MSEPNVSPFVRIANCVDQIRTREISLGTHFGDGPTSEKLNELMAALVPITDYPDSVECTVLLHAFRASIETEMTWLVPERDSICTEMLPALQEVQEITGRALVAVDASWGSQLEKLASLQVVAHAASRQSKLRGNKVSVGMVAARFLNKIGAKRTAESIANSVVKRWQS